MIEEKQGRKIREGKGKEGSGNFGKEGNGEKIGSKEDTIRQRKSVKKEELR